MHNEFKEKGIKAWGSVFLFTIKSKPLHSGM